MIKRSFTVPKTLAEKFGFQHTLMQSLAEKATAWSIPEAIVTQATIESEDYELKYEECNNSQTQSPAMTAARNDAWNVLESTIYSIYNRYLLYNDAISAKDRDTLHIYDVNVGGRTAYDAPVTSPVINLSTEDISVLHVNYATSTTSNTHRKPDGVAFCEIACKVGGEVPASIDECVTHYFIARSHQEIVFGPNQRGSTVYAYARWVNRNGKTGPWGSQIRAIIP